MRDVFTWVHGFTELKRKVYIEELIPEAKFEREKINIHRKWGTAQVFVWAYIQTFLSVGGKNAFLENDSAGGSLVSTSLSWVLHFGVPFVSTLHISLSRLTV